MKWEEKLTPASIKDNNRTSHQEMTILVAEDYQSNYDLIEAMLGKMYKLVHAHDGMEAIIFYEQYKPDLILMDIKMPNINGLDATKAIREMSASVPVIAVSAYAYEKDKIAAIESGCNDYKQVSKTKVIYGKISRIQICLFFIYPVHNLHSGTFHLRLLLR